MKKYDYMDIYDIHITGDELYITFIDGKHKTYFLEQEDMLGERVTSLLLDIDDRLKTHPLKTTVVDGVISNHLI